MDTLEKIIKFYFSELIILPDHLPSILALLWVSEFRQIHTYSEKNHD